MPEESKTERTPEFRRITIDGLMGYDVKTPIKIVGLPEAPISDITLKDIDIRNAKLECVFEDCDNLRINDVYVDGKEIKF